MKKTALLLLTILIIAGMCIPASAANMSFKIGSFLWEDGGYLFGIPKDTSYTVLANNFTASISVKNASGSSVTGSSYVGTGSTVTSGKSLKAVVLGDVSGDGQLTSTDYLRIKAYCGGTQSLQNEYFYAADVDSNGKIQSYDYISIKRTFTGQTNIYSSFTITPKAPAFNYVEHDTSSYRMNRDEISIGVFRVDGELWDDTHMKEFKQDFGGDYIMSYSAHSTGRKVSTLYSLCDKYGIGMFGRSLSHYTYPNPGEPNPINDDPNYTSFDNTLKSYKYNNSCIWADDLYDEPRSNAFSWIQGAITRYKKKFPDPANRFIYVNLNPMNQQAGNTEGFGSSDYTHYIADYVNTIDTDYISFDVYPFDNHFTGLSRNYYLNLDTVAKAAKESGRDFWIIIQAGENPAENGAAQLSMKGSQLKFQVYSSLSYGAKSIVYACYSPCWWKDGTSLVTQSGNKTSLWYTAQGINRDLEYLSPTYMNYDYLDTYGAYTTSIVTGNIKLQNKRAGLRGCSEPRGFKDFETANGVSIGSFAAKSGNGYAVLLAEATDPYDENVSTTVTFKTTVSGTVKCIQNRSTRTLTPDANGVYSVTLQSGDGAFITVG